MSSPPTHQPAPDEVDDPDLEIVESKLEPAVAAPPKQRRRPALIGLGVALVALGGLGAAWLATSVSNTVDVIALSNDVARGEIIEESDLTTASINADPSLQPIRDTRLGEIAGQYATSDLSAGGLLTEGDFDDLVQPAEGEAMVGVAVTSAQLPAEALRPGDIVRIVDTPNAQDEPPSDTPDSIEATVVRSSVEEESGQRIVDVIVPEVRAPDLAARVATGRIAVVLMSRAGGD
ncbi:SAF domain-containing protein [Jiangella gansuensis]|uniref:SAF domain-containing protein n=1 Tax=Jiangella gansuensis TaxID=281473 RepID=UPI0004B8CC66|nr:SAF domain-containing protein [Jiangella gansuensis]